MNPEIFRDLTTLISDVISLLRARELERAFEQVRAAQRVQAARSYAERAEVNCRASLAIRKLQTERDRVRAALQSLPEEERLFAEAQIEPILDKIFNHEIAELRAIKRQYARTDSSLLRPRKRCKSSRSHSD